MANTTNFSIEKASVGGARNSWGGIANVGIDKIDELLALAMPIGTIQIYPKSTAPAATTNGGTWLVCNGGTLVRTDYPDLHTLITNSYGTYPSGTTFLLPDLRSRVPVGYNTDTISGRSTRAIALGSGTETHTLLDAEIPKHPHSITDNGHIHPIDPATTHFHVGDQTGGKTGSKTLVITDPKHSHSHLVHHDWSSGTYYDLGIEQADQPSITKTSSSESTGISIADHDHSLTTDAKPTGITTTQTNPARITTTNEQSVGDGAHNIMQPYLVVNYIILAKHPTF
jgi:microcystin-dependent protein